MMTTIAVGSVCLFMLAVRGVCAVVPKHDFEGRTVTATSVDSLSAIAYQYTATLFDRVEQYCQDSGQTIFLGSFTNATGDVFYFEGGDICSGNKAWSGSATFKCGSESSVSVMKRVGVCQLALQFEDPQLCVTEVSSRPKIAGLLDYEAFRGITTSAAVFNHTTGFAYKYTATLFDRVEQYCQDSGQTIFLGSFTNATGDVFYFEGGEICSGNVTWSGFATFSCAYEPKVAVFRNSSCYYELHFEDPQFCSGNVPVAPPAEKYPAFLPSNFYPLAGSAILFWFNRHWFSCNLFGSITDTQFSFNTLGTISDYSSLTNEFYFTNGAPYRFIGYEYYECPSRIHGKLSLICDLQHSIVVLEMSQCYYSIVVTSPDYCVLYNRSIPDVPLAFEPFRGKTISIATGTLRNSNMYQFTASLFSRIEQFSYATQQTIFLGSYISFSDGWFYFEGGDKCPYSNELMSGKASFSCGAVPNAYFDTDDYMCQYTIQFRDPQLCLSPPNPGPPPDIYISNKKLRSLQGTSVRETINGLEYVFNLYGDITEYNPATSELYYLGTWCYPYLSMGHFFFNNGDSTGCQYPRSATLDLACTPVGEVDVKSASTSLCHTTFYLRSTDYCEDSPTYQPIASPSQDSMLEGPALIGIVVGSVLGFLLLAGMVVCVRRIRTKSSDVHSRPNTSIELPPRDANSIPSPPCNKVDCQPSAPSINSNANANVYVGVPTADAPPSNGYGYTSVPSETPYPSPYGQQPHASMSSETPYPSPYAQHSVQPQHGSYPLQQYAPAQHQPYAYYPSIQQGRPQMYDQSQYPSRANPGMASGLAVTPSQYGYSASGGPPGGYANYAQRASNSSGLVAAVAVPYDCTSEDSRAVIPIATSVVRL